MPSSWRRDCYFGVSKHWAVVIDVDAFCLYNFLFILSTTGTGNVEGDAIKASTAAYSSGKRGAEIGPTENKVEEIVMKNCVTQCVRDGSNDDVDEFRVDFNVKNGCEWYKNREKVNEIHFHFFVFSRNFLLDIYLT